MHSATQLNHRIVQLGFTCNIVLKKIKKILSEMTYPKWLSDGYMRNAIDGWSISKII